MPPAGRSSDPETKPIRLFVACEVPDAVKTRLAETIAPFRGRLPGARWTGSDAWHVTVKFLGWVWPRLESEVKAAVGRVAGSTGEPFRTRLAGLGAFPSPNRARVLWAGFDDSAGRYTAVATALDKAFQEHFEPELRSFTPHLTLARLLPPRRLSEFVPDLLETDIASEPFMVDRLVLYRSHLSSRGARYEPLLEAKFGEGA